MISPLPSAVNLEAEEAFNDCTSCLNRHFFKPLTIFPVVYSNLFHTFSLVTFPEMSMQMSTIFLMSKWPVPARRGAIVLISVMGIIPPIFRERWDELSPGAALVRENYLA